MDRWRTGRFLAGAAMLQLALAACGDAGDRTGGGDVASRIPEDGLVAVNGTRLWIHREGAGEPAIVVHGGPVLDHSYLVPWLAPLGDELELIFYDQRLSGRSDGVVDSATVRLATFVEDVEALRDTLKADRIHLIAHSWGGLLALAYALEHPDRLHSLILLDPMPPSAALWQAEQRALAERLTAADTAGGGALRATDAFAAREPDAVEAVLVHGFRSQFHDPALADTLDFHLEPDYAERSRQFGFMLPDLMAYDLVPRLGEVDVPTLLVYGEEEPGATIGGDALVAGLPNATLVTIPEAGHFPFVERPVAFLGAVRAFLAR